MEKQIEKILKDAVIELNEQLNEDEKIVYDLDVKLIGSKSKIDSMSFVTLVAIIEDLISEQYEKNIKIVSDKAFSQERSPFYSFETLGEFIEELLKETD